MRPMRLTTTRRITLVSSLLVCSGLIGCSGSRTQTPAAKVALSIRNASNLVVVTIDTLRADHLGCYGYRRIETPVMDGLAQSGVLFESVVAQAPLTPPSHASIFTGNYPTVHGVRDTGGFSLDKSHLTLASLLQQRGWQTGAIVGSAVLNRTYGLNQGFQSYDDQITDHEPGGVARDIPCRRASQVVDRAIAWLQNQSTQVPFFLWVHLYDPHAPYDPPPPFREKYKDHPYDGEISYTDKELGRLLGAVGKKSPPEKTFVVLLSDHGESLSEHGELTHGVFLYDSTLRVPWIMTGPGVPAGKRVEEQVRTIDLLPTLLDLLGGEISAYCQGVSLKLAFSGHKIALPYAYAETLYPKINMGWAELRSIRTAQWKYVRAPHPELYDLTNDPQETTNVLQQHPPEVKELEEQLRQITSTGLGNPPEQVQITKLNAETERLLQSLGYLTAGTARMLQLTGEGPDPKDRRAILNLIEECADPNKLVPARRRIPELERALKEDRTNSALYCILGEAYEKAHRDEAALMLYQAAIQRGVAADHKIYVRMAGIYGRSGRIDEGIAAFESALEIYPTDLPTRNKLALAYVLRGQMANAERTFSSVLALDETDAQAHNGLGWIAMRKGDRVAARHHLSRALQLDPGLLEAYINLGMLYRQEGERQQSRACFETFLAKASGAKNRDSIQAVQRELATMKARE